MERPQFSAGDIVQFEADKEGNGSRWCLNTDKGGCGQLATGQVEEVTDYRILVVAVYPTGYIDEIAFPNFKSTDYEEDQWNYPGYLRFHPKFQMPKCDCGCGDHSNYHWQFCSRGKHIDAHKSRYGIG